MEDEQAVESLESQLQELREELVGIKAALEQEKQIRHQRELEIDHLRGILHHQSMVSGFIPPPGHMPPPPHIAHHPHAPTHFAPHHPNAHPLHPHPGYPPYGPPPPHMMPPPPLHHLPQPQSPQQSSTSPEGEQEGPTHPSGFPYHSHTHQSIDTPPFGAAHGSPKGITNDFLSNFNGSKEHEEQLLSPKRSSTSSFDLGSSVQHGHGDAAPSPKSFILPETAPPPPLLSFTNDDLHPVESGDGSSFINAIADRDSREPAPSAPPMDLSDSAFSSRPQPSGTYITVGNVLLESPRPGTTSSTLRFTATSLASPKRSLAHQADTRSSFSKVISPPTSPRLASPNKTKASPRSEVALSPSRSANGPPHSVTLPQSPKQLDAIPSSPRRPAVSITASTIASATLSSPSRQIRTSVTTTETIVAVAARTSSPKRVGSVPVSSGNFSTRSREEIAQDLRKAVQMRDISTLENVIAEAEQLGLHFEARLGRKQLARLTG